MNEGTILILQKLEELKTDVGELKTDVSELKTDVSGLKTDVSGLKTDMMGVKEELSELKKEQTEMKKDLANTKEELGNRIHSLELTLENVTNHNIQIIAENHLDLNRKLNEALKIELEKEIYMIQFNHLKDEVRKIKEHLQIV